MSRHIAARQSEDCLDPGPAHGSRGVRAETLRTWEHQRVHAKTARPARRVDWPLTVDGELRLPRWQSPKAGPTAGSVLRAMDELSQYRDECTLLRRAVELSRDCLGLQRTAIFLSGPSSQLLCGTWGTAMDGRTTDEREIAFLMGRVHREAIAHSGSGTGRWLLIDRAPLTEQVDGTTVVRGHGWNALTPIRSGRCLMGLLVNDAGLSGHPFDELRQDQAALLCAMLGSLLQLIRVERRLSAVAQPRESQGVDEGQANGIVQRALVLLGQDLQLGRAELAEGLGVSVSALSRAFKTQMGLSVTEYRSRLRLERFLTLVDKSEGNLLAAALDAGFGSYAQFHRVFRSVLGQTPRQYLNER